MPEMSDRTGSRLDPVTAWTMVTESPLKGLAFAREAGRILAWDEGNQLYLLNAQGESLSFSRLPQKIAHGAISDEGSLIALVGEADEGGLLLLSADFDVTVEKQAPSDPALVTIDPHGRYIAIGSRLGAVTFLNRYGRSAGRLETIQPLAHLCFLADRPFLVGAAAFGMLIGLEVLASHGSGRLEPEIVWQDRLMSNVGRLTTSGDGAMILASCFTHGIQRFDLKGRSEGSYHLGGTVSHAVPDFPGRTIAAATLEGELAIMSSAGNVRWKTRLSRPAIALEIDPLGRYVVYGHSTGEIIRLDLFGPGPTAEPDLPRTGAAKRKTEGRPARTGTRTATGSVRQPDWTAPIVASDEQAETAVLIVADEPPCVASFTSPHRLEIHSVTGERLGQGPQMSGVGRILRTAPGWLAAATDRQILLCDLRRKTQQKLDLSLVELTHLAIRPDTFGLILVQERDRIGRVTPSSRWVWKRELRSAVEDVAIGPEGSAAVTTSEGQLLVFDPAGEPSVGATFDPADPPLLIEAPDDSPSKVTWLTVSRRSQQLSGHDASGKAVWTRQIAFEGWSLARLGRFAVVASADGRVQAVDGSGKTRFEGPASGNSSDLFTVDEHGEPVRISRREVHLICATLDGRVRWRAVSEVPLGPFAAGPAGVAIMMGRSLAWFGAGEARAPRE